MKMNVNKKKTGLEFKHVQHTNPIIASSYVRKNTDENLPFTS